MGTRPKYESFLSEENVGSSQRIMNILNLLEQREQQRLQQQQQLRTQQTNVTSELNHSSYSQDLRKDTVLRIIVKKEDGVCDVSSREPVDSDRNSLKKLPQISQLNRIPFMVAAATVDAREQQQLQQQQQQQQQLLIQQQQALLQSKIRMYPSPVQERGRLDSRALLMGTQLSLRKLRERNNLLVLNSSKQIMDSTSPDSKQRDRSRLLPLISQTLIRQRDIIEQRLKEIENPKVNEQSIRKLRILKEPALTEESVIGGGNESSSKKRPVGLEGEFKKEKRNEEYFQDSDLEEYRVSAAAAIASTIPVAKQSDKTRYQKQPSQNSLVNQSSRLLSSLKIFFNSASPSPQSQTNTTATITNEVQTQTQSHAVNGGAVDQSMGVNPFTDSTIVVGKQQQQLSTRQDSNEKAKKEQQQLKVMNSRKLYSIIQQEHLRQHSSNQYLLRQLPQAQVSANANVVAPTAFTQLMPAQWPQHAQQQQQHQSLLNQQTQSQSYLVPQNLITNNSASQLLHTSSHSSRIISKQIYNQSISAQGTTSAGNAMISSSTTTTTTDTTRVLQRKSTTNTSTTMISEHPTNTSLVTKDESQQQFTLSEQPQEIVPTSNSPRQKVNFYKLRSYYGKKYERNQKQFDAQFPNFHVGGIPPATTNHTYPHQESLIHNNNKKKSNDQSEIDPWENHPLESDDIEFSDCCQFTSTNHPE